MRVDKWIWAVRMVKSRTLAGDFCKTGKVKVNGANAKPSKEIKLGDMVEVDHKIILKRYEVTGFIPKRVSAELAAQNYIDHTPPPEKSDEPVDYLSQSPVYREKGLGRPTKKERRDIDMWYDEWY